MVMTHCAKGGYRKSWQILPHKSSALSNNKGKKKQVLCPSGKSKIYYFFCAENAFLDYIYLFTFDIQECAKARLKAG
jgi:hypothetical protein